MGGSMNELENLENMVLINTLDFKTLIKIKTEHELLISALFEGAKLNYSGKELSFDDEAICVMLKAMQPDDYTGVLQELQQAKAAKEAANGNV